ncbi:uncharacterized protein TRUGW13939_02707 [Talaromyces rugulosus]|uniref:Uncharacterized protein n=1 Tax=Talaromyces rugulosus TaxID=121627 RepID=A0A7H8QQ54_TALRU|nr:uncharacterized protein TRUGW13939_02707 [Talaromyces rugulosus]QKX55611.1 hypothetical protein TRUGW13939_02707 [Talaromyces rugulosus]
MTEHTVTITITTTTTVTKSMVTTTTDACKPTDLVKLIGIQMFGQARDIVSVLIPTLSLMFALCVGLWLAHRHIVVRPRQEHEYAMALLETQRASVTAPPPGTSIHVPRIPYERWRPNRPNLWKRFCGLFMGHRNITLSYQPTNLFSTRLSEPPAGNNPPNPPNPVHFNLELPILASNGTGRPQVRGEGDGLENLVEGD